MNRKSFKILKRSEDIKHGDECSCDCGAEGRWDEMSLGKDKNEAEFEDAVFFNKHEKQVECYDCWLK